MFEKQYQEFISSFEESEQVEVIEEMSNDEFLYYEMVERFENDLEIVEWYELTGELIK